MLSFLAYGTFGSTVQGLNDFPIDDWPDNVELVYYSYHIMVGLGTLMTLVMMGATVQLAPASLRSRARPLDAHAGITVSLHRHDGRLVDRRARPTAVDRVRFTTYDAGRFPAGEYGDVVFTTLGFVGLYALLGLLFVFQLTKEISRGPVTPH